MYIHFCCKQVVSCYTYCAKDSSGGGCADDVQTFTFCSFATHSSSIVYAYTFFREAYIPMYIEERVLQNTYKIKQSRTKDLFHIICYVCVCVRWGGFWLLLYTLLRPPHRLQYCSKICGVRRNTLENMRHVCQPYARLDIVYQMKILLRMPPGG